MEDFGVEGPVGALGPSGWGEPGGQGVLGPDLDWVSISEAVEGGGATLAAMLMDILGLGERERERAQEMIGKGGEEAERATLFLMATQISDARRQMRDERKWRSVNFLLGLAGFCLAAFAVLSQLMGW